MQNVKAVVEQYCIINYANMQKEKPASMLFIEMTFAFSGDG